MAAGVVAGAGTRDLSCQSNPAREPETGGNDLNSGDHEFVREARKPQRRKSQIGDCNNQGPTAVEKHKIDGV